MLQPGESGARLLHFGLQLLQVNAGNGVKGAAHIAISSMLMILYELTYPFAICFQCVFNRVFQLGKLIAVNISFRTSLATAACCSNLTIISRQKLLDVKVMQNLESTF